MDCDCDHEWVECSRHAVFGKVARVRVSYACDKCGRIKNVEQDAKVN